HEAFERREAHRHFVIGPEVLLEADRRQIEVEAHEQLRVGNFQLELLAQLATQRLHRVLAGIDTAAEQAPMPRIPDGRYVAAQLQHGTAVLQDDDGGGGVRRQERRVRREEMIDPGHPASACRRGWAYVTAARNNRGALRELVGALAKR